MSLYRLERENSERVSVHFLEKLGAERERECRLCREGRGQGVPALIFRESESMLLEGEFKNSELELGLY
jgi:hypothetical protein